MKGIGKIVIAILSLSFFFVLYVRGQVALLHVSYDLDKKADKVAQLSEEYRRLKFEVDQLKAPRLLEAKMKQHSMELTLPQEIRVVRLPLTMAATATVSSAQKVSSNPIATGLSSFFGRWIDVAQAKTDN